MTRVSILAWLALAAVYACGAAPKPGPAVRIASGGTSDTLIVNYFTPEPLPVRAFDAAGRSLVVAPIRYERISGATFSMTPAGVLTCSTSGDMVVRATLERLAASLLIRCRPVERVQVSGPIQFVLGDSEFTQPIELPISAYGLDKHPVSLLAGTVSVLKTSVATARGITVTPRSRGVTIVCAYIGNRDGCTGVHIYQRVDALDPLDTVLRVDPHQRQFAVPVSLAPGESRRQHLPPGGWMLTTVSHADKSSDDFGLRFENASCKPNFLNDPRRFGCQTGDDAAVIVYRPHRGHDTSVATAYLLIRWLYQ